MLELLEDAQLKALNRDNVGDTTGEGVDGVCSDVWLASHSPTHLLPHPRTHPLTH